MELGVLRLTDQSERGITRRSGNLNRSKSRHGKGNVDEAEHENRVDTNLHLATKLELVDEGEWQQEDFLLLGEKN